MSHLNLIPRYAAFSHEPVASRNDWQPKKDARDILDNLVPRKSNAWSLNPNKKRDTFAPIATQYETFRQFGRAVAHLRFWDYVGVEGAWHIISHKHEDKMIRVSIQGNNAYVQEKTKSDTSWKFHQIQQVLTIKEKDGQVEVFGADYRQHKDWDARLGGKVFRSVSGIWAIRFAVLPKEVADAANTMYVTKYHFIAKCLQRGQHVSIKVSGLDKSIGKWFFIDGFKREAFRICGYSYSDIPAPLNDPTTITVERQAEISDWARQDTQGVGDAIREFQEAQAIVARMMDSDPETAAAIYADAIMSELADVITEEQYNAGWQSVFIGKLRDLTEGDAALTN